MIGKEETHRRNNQEGQKHAKIQEKRKAYKEEDIGLIPLLRGIRKKGNINLLTSSMLIVTYLFTGIGRKVHKPN